MKNKNYWKEFCNIIGVPYNKRFSTNGFGDLKINNKGLYIYRMNKEDFCGYWHEDYDWNGGIMDGLLDGTITINK